MTLWREEIEVSIAHAKMLGETQIIPKKDSEKIVKGLKAIFGKLEKSQIEIPRDSEDIHAFIESALFDLIGESAGRLHTARSRNDQIVAVTRLWLLRRINEIISELKGFQKVLLQLGEKHAQDPMPGYTHQQRAQPITLGYYFLALFFMMQRAGFRFEQLKRITSVNPLGSAAMSGTPFQVDRKKTSNELGFEKPSANALDSVSDRDFIGDALHAMSSLMQNLSRISQDIILFCSQEFGFMKLNDAFSTGSSIMPQKRNPDFAELIRGRSARVLGHYTGFMAMMKALPLGYNRDQQEDKPPLFDSVRIVQDSLVLCREMIRTGEYRVERMKRSAGEGFSTATTLADLLTKRGLPFRKAHELTGQLVKECIKNGWEIAHLSASQLKKTGVDIPFSLIQNVSVEKSIESRSSQGGVSKSAMHDQIKLAKKLLQKQTFDEIA